MGGTKPFIPIGATYLFGLKNNKSFLEAGPGMLLAEKSMWNEKLADDSAYLDPYRPVFIPSIGYRHHTSYGLLWRFSYTPVIAERKVPWLFGFSLGCRI